MARFDVARVGAILAVSDFAASLAFYRDSLGLEVEAVARPVDRDGQPGAC